VGGPLAVQWASWRAGHTESASIQFPDDGLVPNDGLGAFSVDALRFVKLQTGLQCRQPAIALENS
jgi:hypothetical protein